MDELIHRCCFLKLAEGQSAEDDVVAHLVGKGADVFFVLYEAGLVDFLGLAKLVGFLLDGQQKLGDGCLEGRLVGVADCFEDVVITKLEYPA